MKWLEKSGDWFMVEANLRASTPVFINSYNQLHYLRAMVEWFSKHGFSNVTVLDNASTYGPLIDFLNSEYASGRFTVRHLGENQGPRKSVQSIAENESVRSGFIFSDPDLLMPEPPAEDFLTRMIEAGKKYQCPKVGPALSLDKETIDLEKPWFRGKTVYEWEKQFWKKELEPGVFRAKIDTTFFLYVPEAAPGKKFNEIARDQPSYPALRMAGEGFTAIHRPWLLTDDVPDEEIRFYHNSATRHSTLARHPRKEAPAKTGAT